MKILTIIGSYIKTHIITTAVVGTAVVGGTIATPIIINNVDNQNSNVVEKAQDEQELTCAEGFELINGNCTEIETEEPESTESENETETNTDQKENSNTANNSNKTDNKISTNNNTQTNNNQTNNTSKPQESKPSCNDISCKIIESNRVVYYEGKMLFGIKVFQPYGYDVDGWQYNSSLIQSLSKEDRTYILNNYFKKETYCDTNPRTPSNCLKYSAFEDRMDEIIKTSKDENYYNSSDEQANKDLTCIAYLQNGTTPTGYDKNTMDSMCYQEDGLAFKWTIEDFQHHYNENRRLHNLHTNVINECNSYKTAYQTTRSLLQQ